MSKTFHPSDAAIEVGPAIRGACISQAQTEMKNWILSANSEKGNREITAEWSQ